MNIHISAQYKKRDSSLKLLYSNLQGLLSSWHLYKLVGYHPYKKEREIRKNIHVHVFISFEEEETLKTQQKLLL